ncbi:hypothetical protein PMIN01_04470 [Paraphaeosphaeria minitans]|uniref:Uncharacterized protein n=1 Tax=Paraphaeosphaeria minitans TaxID=565426 RepID=A0A9P6KSB2_9PLEO|nr:hypothetical protein PMIN01_04470 [Paraphaeosphaeria minitans]
MVNCSCTSFTTVLIRQDLYMVPELYRRYHRVLLRPFCVSIQSSNSSENPCYVHYSPCLRCTVTRSLFISGAWSAGTSATKF